MLLLCAGGAIAVGSTMPWIKADLTLNTITMPGLGTDGLHGIVTLFGGLLLALLGLFALARRTTVAVGMGWLVVVILTAFVVLDFVKVSEWISMEQAEAVYGTYGAGLWVIIAGLVLAVAALVVRTPPQVQAYPQTPPPPPLPPPSEAPPPLPPPGV